MEPDLIFSHADVDGLCSAALLLSRFPKAKIFFTKPVSLFFDLKYRKEKNIIIADIALNKRDIPKILKELKKRNFLYFDHHPYTNLKLPENFIVADVSTSESVYKYFQKDIPKEQVWTALYGAIADYCADTEFVKSNLKDWDVRSLYFEVSTLVLGIKMKEFSNYNVKRDIVKALASGKTPSEIPGLVLAAKKAVAEEFKLYELVKKKAAKLSGLGYFLYDEYFGFRGPAALFAATATDSVLGVSVFKVKGFLDVTLRSRKSLPLNDLAEKAAEAVGGSGGGHPEAAGARIPGNRLEEFLSILSKLYR